MFCRLFAWYQLDFSAILVSISTVSLRRLTTYIILDFKVANWAVSSLTHLFKSFQVNMFISRFMIQILHTIQNVQEGKRHQKKRDITVLKGHGNEADFLGFLQKLGPHRSLTVPFEPFRFWLQIRGDIRNRKTTPRLSESGSC
jgi:hypothetical protein